MNRIPTLLLVLFAIGVAYAAGPVEPLKPIVPASSIERTENNPAKAAVSAREAQKKLETQNADKAAATADAILLIGKVDEALAQDARTAKMPVQVLADDTGSIVLQGTVPSQQLSAAIESVASRAAGRPVQNKLVILAK